ncbi:MAG: class II glutamine amidotransferase [Sulfolobaceae archaeon]
MCRLLAFRSKEINRSFVSALVKSAENDIYSRYGMHPHGWGIVCYIKKGSKWRILYHKSTLPIYQDESLVEILDIIKGDEVVGIIHARRASKEFLLGVLHNHPYYYSLKDKELFFAHNGSVKRDVFKYKELQRTDSYLVFMEIIDLLNTFDVLESYKQVINRLGPYSTSLNSSLLVFWDDEPNLYFAHYYNKFRIRDIEEYYKIYEVNGYVFSSTLKYYLGIEARSLELGEILSL